MIIAIGTVRYCVVVKADILEWGLRADASQACFHSRDNPLKGDRRCPCWILRRWARFPLYGEGLRMLSRALSLATVTLLIGCLTAVAVHAVENLEAGKSPAQIFAGTCNACHKSPRGLLRSVPASSLPGFLRQHYTTSSDMASVLSSYLVSNGATDTRYQGKDAKQGKDGAKEGTKEAARAPADQGAKQPPP